MRIHAAPAGRGVQQSKKQRWAWLRLGAVLLVLPFAAWPSATLANRVTPADTNRPEAQRHLQPASGAPSQPLKLSDLHGTEYELAQMTGRFVLVHFFATWCEPCRSELASLSDLVARKGNQKLFVLAVSVAEPPARVRRFFEKVPVNYPVLLDKDRAVTRAWGVSMLPTTFVLDRHGAVRLHVEGDLDWLRPDVLASLEQVEKIDPK